MRELYGILNLLDPEKFAGERRPPLNVLSAVAVAQQHALLAVLAMPCNERAGALMPVATVLKLT